MTEKSRALAAIEAAMRRDEPLASTLKRALGISMPFSCIYNSILHC